MPALWMLHLSAELHRKSCQETPNRRGTRHHNGHTSAVGSCPDVLDDITVSVSTTLTNSESFSFQQFLRAIS